MSSTGISSPKRKVLSLNVKRANLEEVWCNAKKSEIAHKYEIAPSTLSTIIKNGDKIDAALNDDAGSINQKKLHKPSLYNNVEEALYRWFVDARAKAVPKSSQILLEKARNLGFVLKHDNFEPGSGWLQCFKDRHSITCKHIVGEAASC
ncbi:hypothetical protein HPB47_012008 [Ixodes persulcatus]|uniref:Uncharacterized protein n=1 Tax=Ixodes persulcatus TaxID=34615 RepID=A0AC60NUV7_IXOPE|nr:hypothetical protein HPB47_012008 [Ixodes persulcatus]